MAAETNFDMGRFEEAIETLKQGQQEIRREQSEMKDDLNAIRLTLAEAKGGWAVMLFFGAGLATVLTFIASHIPFLADFLGRAK